MFKCKRSSRCLHFKSVCDGLIECPLGDDEELCNLPSCPWKCRCLHYAITCENIDTMIWTGIKPFIRVNMTNSTLRSKSLQQFTAVTILYLSENSLNNSCTLGHIHATTIRSIDMSHNYIKHLQKACIKPMKWLSHLDLSHNLLTLIPVHISQLFVNLQFLDISFNAISEISAEFVSGLQNLRAMNILQKRPISLDGRLVNRYVLLLLTNDFHVCCFTSHKTLCTSKITWPFTCGNLLDSTILRCSSG